jgi:DNA-binding transcriptional LysR family regulator
MLDCTLADLRVLRAVVQRGSFTAAAAELGYTQSAVSKRIAALETSAGHELVERERRGVRLTGAGEVLLRHAADALESIEAAERELDGAHPAAVRPVRLGAFASAAAGLLPRAIALLSRECPEITLTVREGTSAVLSRGLRAGTLDLALLAAVSGEPPADAGRPQLDVETLAEGPLRIVVGAGHRLAGRSSVTVAELAGERWAAARSEAEERLLGVWPGASVPVLRPFLVRDWLTKLRLVASGVAITTVPDVLIPALPPDVRAIAVSGGPVERRHLQLARVPGPYRAELETVAAALRRAAVRP